MKNQLESAFEGGLRFLHLGFGARGQHRQLDFLEDAGFDFAAEGSAIAVGKKALAVFIEGFLQHETQRKVAGVVSSGLLLDGFALGDGQRVPVDLQYGLAFDFDLVLVKLANAELVTEQFNGSHRKRAGCSIIH
jgi:hypothetical protein